MKTITLFVADTDQEHIRRTRKAIAGRQELTFMGSCSHGHMAFRRLLAESADILLPECFSSFVIQHLLHLYIVTCVMFSGLPSYHSFSTRFIET